MGVGRRARLLLQAFSPDRILFLGREKCLLARPSNLDRSGQIRLFGEPDGDYTSSASTSRSKGKNELVCWVTSGDLMRVFFFFLFFLRSVNWYGQGLHGRAQVRPATTLGPSFTRRKCG